MVAYTCSESPCAQSFSQQPAYMNHMERHLNGGQYMAVLPGKRKRRAKTPKASSAPRPGKALSAPVGKKKKRDEKRMETAREEWEERQRRRREESQALSTRTAPVGSNQMRQEWEKRAKKRTRRPKQYKVIASARVGNTSGQAEIVDLRTPSRSPSVELITPRANARGGRFALSPDTTIPSMSRQTTPEKNNRDGPIPSYNRHSSSPARIPEINTTSSPILTPRNKLRSALGTSEQARIAHHHTSLSRSSTPHTFRAISESAVVAHHHSSPLPSTPQGASQVSEVDMLAYHQMSASVSPLRQTTRETSEESVVAHHHTSASMIPKRKATRNLSEEAIVAHHHRYMSSSMSPSPHVARATSDQTTAAHNDKPVRMSASSSSTRQTSEEAVVRHHHISSSMSPTPLARNPYKGTPVSEKAVPKLHPSSSSPPSRPEPPVNSKPSQTALPILEKSCSKEYTDSSVTESDDPPAGRKGKSPLSRPFATTSVIPITRITQGGTNSNSSIKFQTTQVPPDDVFTNMNIQESAPSSDILNPFTPSKSSTTLVYAQALESPITPSRLGPTWKTETAPASVADDVEFDELESGSDGDGDEDETPSPSPFGDHSRCLFSALSSPTADHEAPRSARPQIEKEANESDPDAWAFESGINSNQWDEQPPADEVDVDIHIDEGYSTSEHGTSSEERDDVEVEATCGYRVFAGYTDSDFINPAQWGDRPGNTPNLIQMGRSTSFDSLTPRRPTALEATMGQYWYLQHSSVDTSPISSGERVSAELDSPPHIRADGSSFPSHQLNFGTAADSSQRRSCHSKRDQVILALLQSGHVALATDFLRDSLTGGFTESKIAEAV